MKINAGTMNTSVETRKMNADKTSAENPVTIQRRLDFYSATPASIATSTSNRTAMPVPIDTATATPKPNSKSRIMENSTARVHPNIYPVWLRIVEEKPIA